VTGDGKTVTTQTLAEARKQNERRWTTAMADGYVIIHNLLSGSYSTPVASFGRSFHDLNSVKTMVAK
jgi:hypothetical protein